MCSLGSVLFPTSVAPPGSLELEWGTHHNGRRFRSRQKKTFCVDTCSVFFVPWVLLFVSPRVFYYSKSTRHYKIQECFVQLLPYHRLADWRRDQDASLRSKRSASPLRQRGGIVPFLPLPNRIRWTNLGPLQHCRRNITIMIMMLSYHTNIVTMTLINPCPPWRWPMIMWTTTMMMKKNKKKKISCSVTTEMTSKTANKSPSLNNNNKNNNHWAK